MEPSQAFVRSKEEKERLQNLAEQAINNSQGGAGPQNEEERLLLLHPPSSEPGTSCRLFSSRSVLKKDNSFHVCFYKQSIDINTLLMTGYKISSRCIAFYVAEFQPILKQERGKGAGRDYSGPFRERDKLLSQRLLTLANHLLMLMASVTHIRETPKFSEGPWTCVNFVSKLCQRKGENDFRVVVETFLMESHMHGFVHKEREPQWFRTVFPAANRACVSQFKNIRHILYYRINYILNWVSVFKLRIILTSDKLGWGREME